MARLSVALQSRSARDSAPLRGRSGALRTGYRPCWPGARSEGLPLVSRHAEAPGVGTTLSLPSMPKYENPGESPSTQWAALARAAARAGRRPSSEPTRSCASVRRRPARRSCTSRRCPGRHRPVPGHRDGWRSSTPATTSPRTALSPSRSDPSTAWSDSCPTGAPVLFGAPGLSAVQGVREACWRARSVSGPDCGTENVLY